MEFTGKEDIYWYAVHVRSRHEFTVFEHLTRQKIEAFLPLVEKLSRWKDRKKLIDFPLFPGYLFVHIPKDYDSVLSVLKVKGVVRMLGIYPGEPPCPIPDEQVISLKRLVASKKDIDPYPYLKEGEAVRIKSGPLKGIEGMLVEKYGQHMLVLSVDVLKQGAAVRIAASDVEKI